MTRRSFANPARPIAAGVLLASAAIPCAAATRDVPTTYATINDAIAAAVSGDEIRVRSNHIEALNMLELNGKSVAIRSYNAAFTAPEAGARWESTAVTPNAANYLVRVTNATVVIDGFANISFGAGGSGIQMAADSNVTALNSTFSGMTLANTAAIKADAVANVALAIQDCAFVNGGRSLWYQNVTGTTSLAIDDSSFSGNSSYAIEFRTMAGTHALDITDSQFAISTNSPLRLYFFGTTTGTTPTVNTVDVDRCTFTLGGTARAAFLVGGLEVAAPAGSSADIDIANSVIDLRNAADNAESAAVLSLAETTRRSNVTLRHCTIATGLASHSGIRLRTPNNNPVANTWTVQNCIIDGQGAGTGFKNEGNPVSGSTIVSGTNLINMGSATDGGAGTQLSGSEISGDPLFTDRANGNFVPTNASPALAAGANLGVAEDVTGGSRPLPVASNPDLGAYEILGTAAVGTWNEYGD